MKVKEGPLSPGRGPKWRGKKSVPKWLEWILNDEKIIRSILRALHWRTKTFEGVIKDSKTSAWWGLGHKVITRYKKKIEAIEARNNADSIIHSTEKSLKEHGSKVPKEDKEKIEKSARNIPNVKVTDVNHFSAYDIIKFKKVVFTESSVKELEKRYS